MSETARQALYSLEGTRPSVTPGKLQLRSVPGEPALEYYLYVPRGGGWGAPLFVTIRGLAGRANDHARLFSPLAEERGVVLVAPCFSGHSFRDYQRLGRAGRGERTDLALDRVVAEVGELTGAIGERIFLFGYSGGGQFAHRFAMAHPTRVASAVVASSGWYTFPDPWKNYPYGIKPSPRLPGVRFHPRAFLRVPILVTVGERDVQRDRTLRQSRKVDQQQGYTRLERATRWTEAMTRSAQAHGLPSNLVLQTLPRMGHSFAESMTRGGLGELAFAYLFDREPATRESGYLGS